MNTEMNNVTSFNVRHLAPGEIAAGLQRGRVARSQSALAALSLTLKWMTNGLAHMAAASRPSGTHHAPSA